MDELEDVGQEGSFRTDIEVMALGGGQPELSAFSSRSSGSSLFTPIVLQIIGIAGLFLLGIA
ncbi:hypothetical protein GCM10010924_59490 [Rhizobium wenxiniae]|nr:hypothetical protein GCM10010924_59490 [Rhizobium wenxiniae]